MAKPIDCGANCGWKWGRVKKCKEIRDCACRCSPLKTINPNLYDACKTQCNSSDKPKDHEDFMCRFVGGETMYTNYGMLTCGFQVEESAQYQSWVEQQEAEEVATAGQRKMTNGIIIAMIGLVAFGFIAIIRSRTK